MDADYQVFPDGTTIKLLSDRSAQRGIGPKPQKGMSLVFKTRSDTADFVRLGEAEGYTFMGKDFILGT